MAAGRWSGTLILCYAWLGCMRGQPLPHLRTDGKLPGKQVCERGTEPSLRAVLLPGAALLDEPLPKEWFVQQ